MTQILLRRGKNRRIRLSRTMKSEVQEPQDLRLQNLKICGQVIIIQVKKN